MGGGDVSAQGNADATTVQDKSRTSLRQVSGRSQAGQDRSQDANIKPLTPSTQAEVEACFLKAIELAQHQQAKMHELRATVGLARLRQLQGKHHAAHNTLSSIYNWFTEGFDTADLREAKVMLEKLSH